MPKPKPTRSDLLRAIPRKNTLVKESLRTDKSLRLTAPLKPNPLRKLLAPASTPKKSFDLDDLGLYLWDHLDGQSTIESLIHQFATHHKLNLREAEISITTFLKTLTQRNLIALIHA